MSARHLVRIAGVPRLTMPERAFLRLLTLPMRGFEYHFKNLWSKVTFRLLPWHPGNPRTFIARLRQLTDLTGKPPVAGFFPKEMREVMPMLPALTWNDVVPPRHRLDLLGHAYDDAWRMSHTLQARTRGESHFLLHELAYLSYTLRMTKATLQADATGTLVVLSPYPLPQAVTGEVHDHPMLFAKRRGYRVCRAMLRTFLACGFKALLRRVYRRFGLERASESMRRTFTYSLPLHDPEYRKGPKRLYVLLTDGAPLINTRSCLKLCHGLQEAGIDHTVLSNNATAVAMLRETGVDAHQIACTPCGWRGIIDHLCGLATHHAFDDYRRALPADDFKHHVLDVCLQHADTWSAICSTFRREIQRAFEAAPPAAFITLGESHLMNMVAQDVARPWNPTWFAWNHILTFPIPGNLFFPADRHLFYGQQGVDTYLAAGGDPAHATIVGSPTYDSSVDRDPAKDRDETRRALPAWDGVRPLVVIGTENREGQDYEVAPTMESLAAVDGITVVIKLHPEDSMEHYTAMARRVDPAGEKVLVVGRCDLDALLHTAEALVTMYSNIIVNAASVGTPTIVYDFRDTPRLAFDAEGVSLFADTPEKVASHVRRLLEDATFRTQTVEAATRNITRFIGPGDGQSVRRVVGILRDHLAGTGEA